MKTTIRSLLVVACAMFIAGNSLAQVEPIGPVTLAPNQPFNAVYQNLIPPQPSHKELQFTGNAITIPGAFGTFDIAFDYVDSTGQNVVVIPPISQVTVVGGQPITFDSGIVTLNFCPNLVSLHLALVPNAASVPITITGDYRHQCFAVPEPTGLGAIGLAVLGFIRRRR